MKKVINILIKRKSEIDKKFQKMPKEVDQYIAEIASELQEEERQIDQALLVLSNVVGQSEQLVCPNCEGEGFSGKGTNEILPCLTCFGSGERAD